MTDVLGLAQVPRVAFEFVNIAEVPVLQECNFVSQEFASRLVSGLVPKSEMFPLLQRRLGAQNSEEQDWEGDDGEESGRSVAHRESQTCNNDQNRCCKKIHGQKGEDVKVRLDGAKVNGDAQPFTEVVENWEASTRPGVVVDPIRGFSIAYGAHARALGRFPGVEIAGLVVWSSD